MLPDALGVRLNIGGYACNLGAQLCAFPMPDMAGSHITGSPLYICLGWNDSLRLENFYLYAIEAQTNKPGKICYTKNFNLSEITLDMKDKNAIELKENEQSNIHFNYAETTPDHRTAGNLAH